MNYDSFSQTPALNGGPSHSGHCSRDRRNDRLLRKRDVAARTGISISSIYRREICGRFPKRVQIGLRAVGWYESDIDAFIADPSGYRSDSD
ncbi:AlpA family transcriptional regulator [Sphingobium naphthae]|nr:AlpA family transcriptional regulator [Sphingobium naphthae]